MLGKKQIWATFLFDFKMGRKAEETSCNINTTFGSGTANEHRGQWWVKKFCKGDQSLEDEECSGQQSEADNNQLRALSKLILLQVAQELNINHSMVILHCNKLERWKSSVSGCHRSWLQIKKTVFLNCLLFYATVPNHFWIRLWRAMKSGFYTTSGD